MEEMALCGIVKAPVARLRAVHARCNLVPESCEAQHDQVREWCFAPFVSSHIEVLRSLRMEMAQACSLSYCYRYVRYATNSDGVQFSWVMVVVGFNFEQLAPRQCRRERSLLVGNDSLSDCVDMPAPHFHLHSRDCVGDWSLGESTSAWKQRDGPHISELDYFRTL